MGRGNFEEGKGRPIAKYRGTLWSSMQKQWNDRMPHGLWARIGLRNRVLDGAPDTPWKWAILWGWKGAPVVKYRDTLRSPVLWIVGSVAKGIMS